MIANYRLSFTAATLAHPESVRIAELYTQYRDWDAVQRDVLDANLLQSRAPSSAKRMFREISPRLQGLSNEQLDLLVAASLGEQKALLWYAVCKRYRYVREFAIEVLHEKFKAMYPCITEADYQAFYSRKADQYAGLDAISATTKRKLQTNLFRMLREADLLTPSHQIIPAVLSRRVVQALSQDAPKSLVIFPVHLSNVEV